MISQSRLAAAEIHRQELYAEAELARLVARARPLSATEPMRQNYPRLRSSLARFLARHKPAVLVLDHLGSK